MSNNVSMRLTHVDVINPSEEEMNELLRFLPSASFRRTPNILVMEHKGKFFLMKVRPGYETHLKTTDFTVIHGRDITNFHIAETVASALTASYVVFDTGVQLKCHKPSQAVLIDRDLLRDEVLHDNTYDNDTINYFLSVIDSAEVVNNPPIRAEWIEDGYHDCIACSNCGQEPGRTPEGDIKHSDFCPSCGSIMDKKNIPNNEGIVSTPKSKEPVFVTEENLIDLVDILVEFIEQVACIPGAKHVSDEYLIRSLKKLAYGEE